MEIPRRAAILGFTMGSHRDGPYPLGFRILVGTTGLVIPPVLRALYSTLRIRVLNPERQKEALAAPAIGAIWHNHLLFWAYYFQRRRFIVMVSRSKDGELVTRVVHQMGNRTVRGSSSRGGSKALLEAIDWAKRGTTVAFLVDGPRGPARVAKLGAIVAARDSGLPLIPVVAVTERAWRFKNWDQTVAPVPGSRVALKYGPSMTIPPSADREECERYRAQLDEVMLGLEQEGESWLKRTHP